MGIVSAVFAILCKVQTAPWPLLAGLAHTPSVPVATKTLSAPVVLMGEAEVYSHQVELSLLNFRPT